MPRLLITRRQFSSDILALPISWCTKRRLTFHAHQPIRSTLSKRRLNVKKIQLAFSADYILAILLLTDDAEG